MPVYQITYHTTNEYSEFIHEAILEFLVFPASIPGQKIKSIHFEHQPVSQYYTSENCFGFEFLRFRIKNLEKNFSFTLKASVEKEESNPFEFSFLPAEEEYKIINTPGFQIDNYLFLNIGEHTQIPVEFDFPKKEKTEGVFQFVQQVNQFVHSEIKYDNSVDDPHRLLQSTINERRGVCQDYAHLMLAILRNNKIPARYVSGYLNPGENAVGASAVHAWVEVLVPGAGWIGFDPTNNLLEDHHYIKIAHGVDINDCTTLKGVIKGRGTNQTNYHVLVEEQNKESNQ
ncbi:hypothetical protein GM418_04975 [Maribellus comscasis]|uniref:Transglutaminase-like domain-containing protein n=1 Tax=Maribellus comscasis TaxID=2681766 RepID=A0A6I6JTX1_9BACT|nr:transglutaminase family protein [Maribellus comscasis]QGY43033.1 hypothetical protein GM418_04975 [Maribellus comscasis]